VIPLDWIDQASSEDDGPCNHVDYDPLVLPPGYNVPTIRCSPGARPRIRRVMAV